jgi:hypothetical protein
LGMASVVFKAIRGSISPFSIPPHFSPADQVKPGVWIGDGLGGLEGLW